MRSVTYVGRFQRVEIEVAPRRWRTVAHGETIEVTDAMADNLLAQAAWADPAGAHGDDVPAGTAAEVLAWVDHDPQRAHDALAAELIGKARKGLIADLSELAGTTADDTDHTAGAQSTEEG